jgi:hypothetical protein
MSDCGAHSEQWMSMEMVEVSGNVEVHAQFWAQLQPLDPVIMSSHEPTPQERCAQATHQMREATVTQ